MPTLKARLELPEGVEWRWYRVTNITGFVLALAGLVARVAGHVPGAPLAYSALAVTAFGLGAWRRSVHFEQYVRETRDWFLALERQAAIGSSTLAFAHEMKNGVMVAHGFAELSRRNAEASGSPAALLGLVQSIEKQTSQLTEQLQSFLALGSSTRQEPIQLRSALEQTRALLAPLASVHQRQLDWNVDGTPDRAVNEPAFRQALLNVGINAVEHAHDKVSVSVSSENGEITVSVSDDGPGIPAADRKLLFTPYFHGRTEGHGIGLTQVRQALDAEGGRVSYEEGPNAGACFNLRLPTTR